MEISDPSVFKIVTDGGIVMLLFLIFVIAWFVCSMFYLMNERRGLKSLLAMMLFPVAFGILAIAQLYLRSHADFKHLELSGSIDAMLYAQRGLSSTRSGLLIVATSLLTLIANGLMLLLPVREINATFRN